MSQGLMVVQDGRLILHWFLLLPSDHVFFSMSLSAGCFYAFGQPALRDS